MVPVPETESMTLQLLSNNKISIYKLLNKGYNSKEIFSWLEA